MGLAVRRDEDSQWAAVLALAGGKANVELFAVRFLAWL